MEMLPFEDPELKRSVAAYEWVKNEVPKRGYDLVLTPGVEFELCDADQVNWLECQCFYHCIM